MLTPKQEAFCLAYLETGNASEAYRRSYDAENMKPETVNRSAKELIDNHKITARLDELRAPVVEEAKVSLALHLSDLKRLRDSAEASENFNAAISAEVNRGKASGLYVTKMDVTVNLSLAERMAKARERATRD